MALPKWCNYCEAHKWGDPCNEKDCQDAYFKDKKQEIAGFLIKTRGRKCSMTKKQEMQEQVRRLQEELDKLNEQVESMEDKNEARWRAKKGDKYSFVTDAGDISRVLEVNDEADNFRYLTGNYFETKQEAEEYKENFIIKTELKDLALRLNNGKEIWSDTEQIKYYIHFSYARNKLECNLQNGCPHLGEIYCLDDAFLKIAKKEIGEDKLIRLFKSGF